MTLFGSVRRIFSVQDDDETLANAQLGAIARHMPVLYATLTLNALALAYTHYGLAPDTLTLWPLVLLLAVSCMRAVAWTRIARDPPVGKKAIALLRKTNLFTALLGVGFAVWALLLTGYGDIGTQMQVLFFLTITMIVCAYCLTLLRSAAAIISLIALPLTIYFVMHSSAVLSMTALNYAGVIVAMTFMQSVGYRDFCRLVRLSEENRELAHTDTLTALPNRRSFFARLDETIDGAGVNEDSFAIGMIDLDGFKPVNDTFGHQAGDAVLCEVARRLERVLRGVGWVARLGGDEFGLVIDGGVDIERLGRTICAALARPYALRDATARIGASVGFVRSSEAASAESLVERADCALYYAKSCRRGTAVCFAPEHEARLRSEAVIEQALRSADMEAEFSLVYQPILDVVDGRIEAYEALARWNSPTLGQVSPADFIEVAERAGLIQALSRVLFAKAIVAMRSWPRDVRLSFNLSAHDIAAPDSLLPITRLIEESGIPPQRIIFEVTETGLMRDVADAVRSLQALRDLGMRIALDDFGTGYSSLSYVHKLPISKLKIDRSFVKNLGEDAASLNIIRSIVDLCRNLNLQCIVEGVETTDEMLRLRSAGCRYMQGYLFQRPIPEAEIEAFQARPLNFEVPALIPPGSVPLAAAAA